MKILIFLLAFTAQSQVYTTFSFDVNKLFNLKDNPRTEKNWKGLDYDFEIGAIEENVGVYLFYGGAKRIFYSNYGVGVDYYINVLDSFKISLGNSYTFVARHKKYKYLGRGGSLWNPRGKISYDLSYLIIELIAKFTNRADLGIRIFEGSVGITKKL